VLRELSAKSLVFLVPKLSERVINSQVRWGGVGGGRKGGVFERRGIQAAHKHHRPRAPTQVSRPWNARPNGRPRAACRCCGRSRRCSRTRRVRPVPNALSTDWTRRVPPPRTNWTHDVLRSVLIGHAVSALDSRASSVCALRACPLHSLPPWHPHLTKVALLCAAGSIRCNTTICLGKISAHLSAATRDKVLPPPRPHASP